MAIYEYRCNGCNEVFSVRQRISEHKKEGVVCPKCKGTNVVQQVSSFTARTSRKS